ncbi:beta-N-acetylhexosaminidase [Arthrobacter antibioticus]|uniref:beta-N-acetylhexosaminidase n=1 Tax=Arthrobacter sp. H35-MC1 TaxID=3046203 RepID=UPI0024B9A7DD|nr:beta-N-acetylhexosaminidase [Arthrobacter sp. H35-MC1]MDJ0318230.1 beta-N-acetylhexosaminidase [Arthrobacter sp. H35-MC1]
MLSHTVVPAPWSIVAASPTSGIAAHPALLCSTSSLTADPRLTQARRWLGRALEATTGWELTVLPWPVAASANAATAGAAPASFAATTTGNTGNTTGATVEFVFDSAQPPEGYELRVDGTVRIAASSEAGAFYAAQTVLQLLGARAFRQAPITPSDQEGVRWQLPAVTVTDKPRFGYRGVMLDVARHFQPKDDVLRFIEVAAMHKLNVLHLHLTDDQGWRIHINKYPLLTEVGGWRRESSLGAWRAGLQDGQPHGGFYTQDDLREIVAFAAERNITVIPEIDVPGHSQAAIAAYPELGLPWSTLEVWTRWGINPNVLEPTAFAVDFYQDVLDEVIDIFPSPWIGLGGDEVPLNQWESSPVARQKAAELGYDSVAGLHGWFVGQLAAHLHAHGRKSAVWDEVGDFGLPDGALVASWRGYQGGLDALAKGYDVVMCPEHKLYLDHRQADGDGEPVPVGFVTTLEAVYDFDPMPQTTAGEYPGQLLGAQANIWTEHLPNARRVNYATYPRLSAIAEVFWSNPDTRDYSDFLRRLSTEHLARLSAMGVEFRPLDGPHPWQQRPGIPGWMRDYDQETASTAGAL